MKWHGAIGFLHISVWRFFFPCLFSFHLCQKLHREVAAWSGFLLPPCTSKPPWRDRGHQVFTSFHHPYLDQERRLCHEKNWNYPKEISLEHCFILQEALDLVLRKEYIFTLISLRIQSHNPPEFSDNTLHWMFSTSWESLFFRMLHSVFIRKFAYVTMKPEKMAIPTINNLTSDIKVIISWWITAS